ncbi:DNA (cytosine-5)-methyltransferase 1 [Nocardioides alpinus]|uniref:DNA (cytosine-5-)-methyltransferase n=1 Tax=Nocardioides alpinus TaxID=748909 RepID=A0A1I0VZ22_9ACTN|nr:DNA cytosine methyltransferase [Nocardioides alpinus]PKH37552.1 DNA cytosine methyltransferase [Nocardioides alpinus]SFA81143.1 DNA (cytosine-5)-methyltransferase 1 [Nocardioides alpinus]
MKPTVIDLFAGCGGLGLGLEQAGFETIFVNELHQDALSTYLLNRSDTSLKERQNHSNDILEITQQGAELDALANRLHREHGDVTLVAGGPPCQGYSGIGHRRSFVVTKDEIPSNHLYREMAKVVERVAPKAFLFENVKGLLSARWTPGGDRGEIWEDVQAAFRKLRVVRDGVELHYQLGWKLISAKDYGVPQNRPRVLLVGVRSDLPFSPVLSKAAGGLLPESVGAAPDPIDFLGDLVDPQWRPGGSTTQYLVPARTAAQRLMRTLPTGELLAKGATLTEHEYGKHAPHILAKFEYMLRHNGEIPAEMQTKKFAQRVIPDRWGPGGPNITATSLADDYVHFSQPRVPTVREWARIQTFPDWYEFAGKRTTGGRRRAGDPSIGDWTREVPKYTQIGNAVPVALGRTVGEHILKVVGER